MQARYIYLVITTILMVLWYIFRPKPKTIKNENDPIEIICSAPEAFGCAIVNLIVWIGYLLTWIAWFIIFFVFK